MLDLRNRGYGSKNIGSLIETLELNPNVVNINLYYNNIDGDALDKLIPELLKLPNLKKLNLGCNCIRDKNIAKLTPIVEKGSLERLDLSVNTGLTKESLGLINQWRDTGLFVATYHTPIAPNIIAKETKEVVEEQSASTLTM